MHGFHASHHLQENSNCLTLRLLNNSSYNAFVPELLTGRFRARKLASQYNAPIPDEMTEDELMSKRAEILKKFFGSLGKNSCIEPPLNVDYGCNILVGDDFYSNFG